jgi:ribosomal protein S27E
MPIAVQCPGCEKDLRIKDALAGKKIKCPACTGVLLVPAAAPARAALEVRCVDCERRLPFTLAQIGSMLICPSCAAKNLAEVHDPASPKSYDVDGKPERERVKSVKGSVAETLLCPVCKRMDRADAAECRRCAYNFETQEREPPDADGTWDFALPLWARALIWAGLAGITLPAVFLTPEMLIAGIAWGVSAFVLALICGTFTRLRLTLGKKDDPILIRQRWVAFIPMSAKKYRLWEYDYYDLRYTGTKGSGKKNDPAAAGSAYFSIFLIFIAILLCSAGFIPGLVFWYMLSSSLKEGEGSLGSAPRWGSYVLLLLGDSALEKRVVVYEGLSIKRMKQIQEALAEAAGIRKQVR